MNIIKTLRSLVPARGPRRTIINHSFEVESWVDWMDVDRLSYAIRASRSGSVQQLMAIYRDILFSSLDIQGAFGTRKLAVLADVMSIRAYEKGNAADTVAADYCRDIVEALPSWLPACSHLLDSSLWPVSVVEKVFVPDGRYFTLKELVPVPHSLLDFSTGSLMIRATDDKGQPSLDTLYAPDADRYIVHRGHLLGTADQFGGPMRALLYWWLAATMNLDWWVRFLDRYGMPFPVGKYRSGNNADRAVLQSAFAASKKVFGLVISSDTQVEMIDASKAAADAFEKFQAVCQRQVYKFILGQTLSAQTDATGIGSGAQDLAGEVKDDVRRFDARLLTDSHRLQLLTQMCNLSGQLGRPPRISWGGMSTGEMKATGEMLSAFYGAGVEVDDPALVTIGDAIGYGLRRRAVTPPLQSTFSLYPRR